MNLRRRKIPPTIMADCEFKFFLCIHNEGSNCTPKMTKMESADTVYRTPYNRYDIRTLTPVVTCGNLHWSNLSSKDQTYYGLLNLSSSDISKAYANMPINCSSQYPTLRIGISSLSATNSLKWWYLYAKAFVIGQSFGKFLGSISSEIHLNTIQHILSYLLS